MRSTFAAPQDGRWIVSTMYAHRMGSRRHGFNVGISHMPNVYAWPDSSRSPNFNQQSYNPLNNPYAEYQHQFVDSNTFHASPRMHSNHHQNHVIRLRRKPKTAQVFMPEMPEPGLHVLWLEE